MYSNLTKAQAFPLAIRFSSPTKCIEQLHTSKSLPFPIGFHPTLTPNHLLMNSTTPPHAFSRKAHRVPPFVIYRTFSTGFHCLSLQTGCVAKPGGISRGFHMIRGVHCCPFARTRSLSSFLVKRDVEVSSLNRAEKKLPWLTSDRTNGLKKLQKVSVAKPNRSSWEQTVERLEKESNVFDSEEPARRVQKMTVAKTGLSSREESAEALCGKNSAYSLDTKESRNRMVGRHESVEDERMEEEEVDDTRWNKIQSRFRGIVDAKAGFEKPEVRRWNKQEKWGRQTWKEATESTVPKMVGEGVYGVGPVLAALSAGRREFYALYVQEGLDLSSNNRKKKDKKGFDKVLRMADKIGLIIKEASKHDLNMVVDNRPHQGLVLDASPLEMVKIKELDPVSNEDEEGTLWVALDEVTDPQNLGAIIRSAYFFGVSGVVLCAKNSAPLSGVVSKASAGSLELMELRYCKNMMQFLVSSADNGWRVLGGSVSSKAVPLNEVLPGVPTILVLGSEGTGLRPLVERSCTNLVRIPGNIPIDTAARGIEDMEATEVNSGCSGEEFQSFLAVESLNVSVAAGVLLHHLTGSNDTIKSQVDDKPADALQ